MDTSDTVIAVVVVYYPDSEKLACLLDAINLQVEKTVIVDNTPDSEKKNFDYSGPGRSIHYLPLGQNYGVATAQNAGIKWARENKAGFVILFDQDSVPGPNMVGLLRDAYGRLQGTGNCVAAVGPRYVDERNSEHPSFTRLCGMKLIKSDCQAGEGVIPVDFVISSGALISMETLQRVGLMNEALFIDQIDIEWGLRARHLGCQSYGVCDAVMTHSLGEDPLKILGRKLLNHSPLRHYYIFRNAVWLMRRDYTPIGWRLYFARMICMRGILYTLFIAPRFAYFKMMLKGGWGGLTDRMGRLDSE